MGNYNPIYHTIWTSCRFNLLSYKAKYLFLYLLSNQKIEKTGIYSIMQKQMACDTDLSLEEVEFALDELQANRLVRYWQDENVIFIFDNFKFARNMIRNCAILDKTINSQKDLYKIPELWQMFNEIYSPELEIINKALINHQSNKNKNKSTNKNKSASKSNTHSNKGEKENAI